MDKINVELYKRDYRLVGLLMGYPKCCVEAFCDRLQDDGQFIQTTVKSPLLGSGYVPCLECSKDTVKSLRYIARNREKSFPPFPLTPTSQVLHKAARGFRASRIKESL